MEVVQKTFKPEFLNRLDDVVVFDALSHRGPRADRRPPGGRAGPAARATAGCRWTSRAAAREWLTLTGYDPAYGARPLRRLVQKAIGDTARPFAAGR